MIVFMISIAQCYNEFVICQYHNLILANAKLEGRNLARHSLYAIVLHHFHQTSPQNYLVLG
jgi:hypothetical protein